MRPRSRMLSNRPRSAAFAGEPRAALPACAPLSMFSPSSFPAQRGILATKPGLSLRAAGGAVPAAVPATPRASAGRNRRSPHIPPSNPKSGAALLPSPPPPPSRRGQAPLCTHSTFSWSAPPQLQASTCCWISPWRCGTGSARGHGGLRGRERGTEGPTSRGGAERCALCCRASGLRSCGAALRLRAAAPAPLRAPSALPPRPPRVGVRGGGPPRSARRRRSSMGGREEGAGSCRAAVGGGMLAQGRRMRRERGGGVSAEGGAGWE